MFLYITELSLWCLVTIQNYNNIIYYIPFVLYYIPVIYFRAESFHSLSPFTYTAYLSIPSDNTSDLVSIFRGLSICFDF